MTFLPIVLGIARGNAQNLSGNTQKNELKLEQKAKIFERDNHTCQYCGFQSLKYQDIVFRNALPGDHRPDNMVTACIFCHQCFNLELASQMRSTVPVWLPEMDQATLHHVVRAIYVARISQGGMANAARQGLDMLLQRREEAKKRIGTDDTFILSSVLRDYLTDKHYDRRREKLDGIRLFPLDRRIIKEADLEFNQFPQILAYWRSKEGPFGGRIPAQWAEMLLETRAARAA